MAIENKTERIAQGRLSVQQTMRDAGNTGNANKLPPTMASFDCFQASVMAVQKDFTQVSSHALLAAPKSSIRMEAVQAGLGAHGELATGFLL